MGALHEGHLSLVRQALAENDRVCASIFVNPLQFGQGEDFDRYPRTLESDRAKLEQTGADLLFAPDADEMYPGGMGVHTRVTVPGLSDILCGAVRPGHFEGVATVVNKLFNQVQPDIAVFGEKDFQQLQIIRSLVKQNKLDVRIVGCKIKRESNGLAMSSRNERLTAEQRDKAALLYKMLKSARKKFGTESAAKISEWVERQFAAQQHLDLEYFVIADE